MAGIKEQDVIAFLTQSPKNILRGGQDNLLIWFYNRLTGSKKPTPAQQEELRYLLYEMCAQGKIVVVMDGQRFLSIALPTAQAEASDGADEVAKLRAQILALQTGLRRTTAELKQALARVDAQQNIVDEALVAAHQTNGRAKDGRLIRSQERRLTNALAKVRGATARIAELEAQLQRAASQTTVPAEVPQPVSTPDSTAERIAELEAAVDHRDATIRQLRSDIQDAFDKAEEAWRTLRSERREVSDQIAKAVEAARKTWIYRKLRLMLCHCVAVVISSRNCDYNGVHNHSSHRH